MTLPNFLIIGAAKSGTTALYEYLSQHPQIYMSPVKEPHFFSLGSKSGKKIKFNNIEEYQELFKDVSEERAIGEASPSYLYFPETYQRIQQSIPQTKLIAILRHPVDRAYSNFLHNQFLGWEKIEDFSETLEAEKTRYGNRRWGYAFYYKDCGFYYSQLKRYFDNFPQNQIKVYLYDDLQKDSQRLMQNIFAFLEVDSSFCPALSVKHNVSGVGKNKALHEFLLKTNPIKSILKPLVPGKLRTQIKNRSLTKPKLLPQLRQQLLEEYREDILQLQDLIQRDLSMWLESN